MTVSTPKPGSGAQTSPSAPPCQRRSKAVAKKDVNWAASGLVGSDSCSKQDWSSPWPACWVIDAAITHKASESGGIDKALLTLRNQPFGEFLMMLAALGLVVFGVYGLCEARWRKVLAQRDYGPAREGNLAWLMLPPRCQGM